jgi:hypothetical protein
VTVVETEELVEPEKSTDCVHSGIYVDRIVRSAINSASKPDRSIARRND